MCPLTLLCGAEDVATWRGEDAAGEGGVEEEGGEEGGEAHGGPGLGPSAHGQWLVKHLLRDAAVQYFATFINRHSLNFWTKLLSGQE